MGKSAGSPPPAPDPTVTAQAQAAANQETARTQAALNRVDQYSPYGNITYAQPDPENPDHYTMTTTLSPEQQKLYDATTAGQGIYSDAALSQLRNVQGILSQPFQSNAPTITGNAMDAALQAYYRAADQGDFRTSAPEVTGGAIDDAQHALRSAQAAASQPVNTDYNAIRQQAIDAANSRLDPEFKMQEESLRSRLLNSGITEGSEAWDNAYRQYNNAVNDSRQQTILNAENLAGQAITQTGQLRQIPISEAGQIGQMASNISGMSGQQQDQQYQRWAAPYQSGAQIGNMAGNIGNLNNTQLQQALALRNQPLNEAQALLTGSQVGVPTLQAVPQAQVAPTDVMGAYAQNQAGQQANYQARAQQAAAANSGMYGLGATAIMMAVIA